MTTKNHSVKGVLAGAATLVCAVCIAAGQSQSPPPSLEKPKQAQQHGSNAAFAPSAIAGVAPSAAFAAPSAAPSAVPSAVPSAAPSAAFTAPSGAAIEPVSSTTVTSSTLRWVRLLLYGFLVLVAAATISRRGVNRWEVIE
jgi:hypothetical protein